MWLYIYAYDIPLVTQFLYVLVYIYGFVGLTLTVKRESRTHGQTDRLFVLYSIDVYVCYLIVPIGSILTKSGERK